MCSRPHISERPGFASARLADEGAAEALQNQKIGKRLTKAGILSKIEGEVFANHQLTRAPEYYIVYFSASW